MGDLPPRKPPENGPRTDNLRSGCDAARQSTRLGAAAYSLAADKLEVYEYRTRNRPNMATIFEKIIAGEIPATVVHRDDRVTAFRDISPQAPVHVLIVPNKPIPTVNDVSEDDERTLGHMFVVARDLARAEGIAEDGFRLIINCNKHGGQVVYHLHMHLLGGVMLGPMLSGGKHG